ncbi:hypothetical protein QFC19_006077 [Naganishia cerealis]|uniref:Uncharacterized protein n=1 Tax=Naganishia cerealis TaxID=610337 RepID=A0ACC2VKL3_9TREE|nr:hypothetical protein QFC19_006077 [Naganishia cerealis]
MSPYQPLSGGTSSSDGDGHGNHSLHFNTSQEPLLDETDNRHSLSDSDDDNFVDTNTSLSPQQTANTVTQGPEPVAGSSAELRNSLNNLDLELQTPRKLSARERIINVFHHFVPIRQTYERLNNGLTTGRMQPNTPGQFIGHGTDGVFRNLMAKPDTESNRIGQEQHPPSYEEAAADAVPEYWESTIISPIYEDEVFVEGLPVGNIANFVWNALVTVAFQFVGFVLCYLLHTSHAAKEGSRTGLGITFVFYGWNMVPANFGSLDAVPIRYQPTDPNLVDITHSLSIKGGKVDGYKSDIFQQNVDTEPHLKTPYFAYALIAFGLFMVLKSFVDYYRVKQIEHQIFAPHRQQQQQEAEQQLASQLGDNHETNE